MPCKKNWIDRLGNLSNLSAPFIPKATMEVDKMFRKKQLNVGRYEVVFTTYEGEKVKITYTGHKDFIANENTFEITLKRIIETGFIKQTATRYISIKDVQFIDAEYEEHFIDKED